MFGWRFGWKEDRIGGKGKDWIGESFDNYMKNYERYFESYRRLCISFKYGNEIIRL